MAQVCIRPKIEQMKAGVVMNWKEKYIQGRIPNWCTKFSKGGNLPSPMCKQRNLDHWINESSSSNSQTSNATLLVPPGMKASFSGIKSMLKKKNKHNSSSQPTIKSFFRRPESRTEDANINSLVTSVDTVPAIDEVCYPKDDSLPENIQCTAAAEGQDNSISCPLSTDKCNVATLEWQRIQQRMRMTLPLFKGHREPCIPRSVKKGSNAGRLFYVCSHNQGPSSNPEANCNHFQWASVKSKGKRR